ncbi:MAG: hypothetical protein GX222_08445 [Ruminococcaceae bacterium]|nr:hypothetical protein [Oscillospiraceae bacterium]
MENTENLKKADELTSEDLVDISDVADTSQSNDPAQKTEKKSLPKGILSRIERDIYIIEPARIPRKKRMLGYVSILMLLFFLTSSIFYYSGFTTGRALSGASSINYSGMRKINGTEFKADNKELTSEPLPVTLKGVSVEKDLSVRILDSDGLPIPGHKFEVNITDPTDEVQSYIDDDLDGRIYLSNIDGGNYKVEMIPMDGFITPDSIDVEVRDKVLFAEIENIEEKIVSSKEIDASKDDPLFGNTGNPDAGRPEPSSPPTPPPDTSTPPTPTSTDTVEYVESRVENKEIIKYTGNIGENGRLFFKDGSLSDIIPEIVDGYMTGSYTLYTAPDSEQGSGSTNPPDSTPPSGSEPDSPPDTVPDPDSPEPGVGGDIDLFALDSSGNYVYDVTKHVEYIKTYYGWQEIDGKRYYFDKNGNKITGTHIIGGNTYTFNDDGSLYVNVGTLIGIDVSTWQNYIDWNRVKNSGVSFVMIRAGFRGYGSGKIVEDDMFATNVRGAKAAGLRVGAYFFSQAINEVEGVEEASMVISLLRKYGFSLDYPIAIDSEWSGAPGNNGRADNLSRAQRTAVCVAFCETIRNSGYTPMVYASKSWFENNLSVSSLSGYKIWLAHYTPGGAQSSYAGRYEMWQYTSRGSVDGIAGNVDMNYGYLGY